MKLKYIFLPLLLFTLGTSVMQAKNLPINIVANESITVTLFFPSEIKKVIHPAVNYKFEYEQNGIMGTIAARRGATSNLTVITKGGNIFSFRLEYNAQVENFTFILSEEQAIGSMKSEGSTTTQSNTTELQTTPTERESAEMPQTLTEMGHEVDEKPGMRLAEEDAVTEMEQIRNVNYSENESVVINKSESEPLDDLTSENSLYDTDRESYYDIYCENNYDQEVRLKKTLKAGVGIELQLNTITADRHELYFIFQMTNRLTSRYNMEKMQFYVRTSLGDKPVQMTPVHVFNQQEYIEPGRTKKMVYVMKEFRLSRDQKVYAMLDEVDGDRRVVLKIGSDIINAAGGKLIASAR